MAEWLKHIAEHHKEWVRIVRSWGEEDYAEDLVQEMYLKCLKCTTESKIVTEGKVNKSYIWFVLRSVFLDYKKEQGKVEKLRVIQDTPDTNTVEVEHAYGQLLKKIDEEKNTWHWYDKMLFDLYVNSGMSMREIERETNISLTSIFNTLSNCKTNIKENCLEDIQDYFNGDYEKI